MNEEELLKRIDEIMPQCGEVDCLTCNERHERILSLIKSTSHTQQIALEALYELRDSKQSVAIHTGTDSARPGGYMEVVPVTVLEVRIAELEATLKRAQEIKQ